MRHRAAALILLFAAATPAAARDPLFTPPLHCGADQGCFIPRYVDADPGPGVADFMCGPLTGDGHKGTDFAIASRADMDAGVAVYAAAPGTVRAVRDGEDDAALTTGQTAPAGRECGNGVVVSHGDGWETQYCHLRNGSVAVQQGQRVGAATVLGQVGLSGETSFPHVHMSVRHDGRVVDPFAPAAEAQCGQPATGSLWKDPPTYRPGGLISAGFSTAIPGFDAVKAGTASVASLSADAPALVFWAYAFMGRAGDEIVLRIDGPLGPVIAEKVTVETGQPLFFRAAGRRTPAGGWPAGQYLGTVDYLRNGVSLGRRETALSVGDGG